MGVTVARSTKGVETQKLHQKFPLWVWLFGKPYLQTEFSQKFRLNQKFPLWLWLFGKQYLQTEFPQKVRLNHPPSPQTTLIHIIYYS